jgi:hypothetical protein
MTEDQFNAARLVTQEISALQKALEEWERSEVTPQYLDGLRFIHDAAWRTFRNHCRDDLQTRIDALKQRLADL